MKKEMAATKTCTKCLQSKSTSDFYSKGDRLESICKECKKKKSRSRHSSKVDKEGVEVVNRLKQVSEIVYEQEMTTLKLCNKRLLEILKQCESRY